MAEGNAKIAALRAATREAASAGAPEALNYAWMNTPGRALVMPVRSSPPSTPWKRRPAPDPTTGISVNDIRKAEEPPLPPAGREGRVTNNTPGFVDGLTLPRDYHPTWNYDPGLLDAFMPINDNAPIYSLPLPEPAVEPPTPEGGFPRVDMSFGLLEYLNPQRVEMGEDTERVQPIPQQDVLVSSSQMGMEPQFSDFQLQEFIQPMPALEAPVAANPGVELAPDPVPRMPMIVEPEAPQPVPVRQPKEPQQSIDDMLMRYFMSQDMAEL